MSWLWQDKKTEQLKNILKKAEEDDRNNTIEKLSVIKKEYLEFKDHLNKTFDNTRVTQSKFAY